MQGGISSSSPEQDKQIWEKNDVFMDSVYLKSGENVILKL